MAIPAYLWITDEAGSPIRGGSLVNDREGSIEVLSFAHGVYAPADARTGRLLGSRMHEPMVIHKDFDRASPYLYRAVSSGHPIKTAELRWYKVDGSGREIVYFIMKMEDVRITAVTPHMHDIKEQGKAVYNHREAVSLRYGKITWTHCDGNIVYADNWWI
ncbi:type VI secretion system tube protein Hcp [Dyella monticola]|uniref:Type VI secretion system tube protein Hcp n=1 Tax=Dyella monticola TaxID=1927958 RepID=A0A370WVN2_9GAMM|nr:type VI secretion system tube protein TssD [Dyella monticola]RDS80189.1 type VI secretion system tube protein Hcp [Dyella monticola]